MNRLRLRNGNVVKSCNWPARTMKEALDCARQEGAAAATRQTGVPERMIGVWMVEAGYSPGQIAAKEAARDSEQQSHEQTGDTHMDLEILNPTDRKNTFISVQRNLKYITFSTAACQFLEIGANDHVQFAVANRNDSLHLFLVLDVDEDDPCSVKLIEQSSTLRAYTPGIGHALFGRSDLDSTHRFYLDTEELRHDGHRAYRFDSETTNRAPTNHAEEV